MAQHLLISDKYIGETDEETKAIRKIVRNIKSDIRQARKTDSELGASYVRIPDDHLEGTETEGYLKIVDIPETMVYGGRAGIELRFRMSVLSKVYLVA